MKNLLFGIIGLLLLGICASSFTSRNSDEKCSNNKESMVVVMRFEIKVMPDKVAFLKESFDACKAEVLKKEPGCLDYSLFQSYNDSTLFVINETWATKGDHNKHMELAHTQKHIKETSNIHDPAFKSKTNYMYWVCPDANAKE